MKVSTIWIEYFGFSVAVAVIGFGIVAFSGISLVDSLKIGFFFWIGSLGVLTSLCLVESLKGINLNIPLWSRWRKAMATLKKK